MRSRAVRITLFGVLLVVLLLAAWTAWQLWRVNEELGAAVDDAAALEAALEAGDQPRAESALASLDEHTAAAKDRTDGVTFSVLARLPWAGDDAAGVRVAVDVVGDISRGALRPLVDEAADVDSFLPREGRIPVDRLAQLQEPVAAARDAFAEGASRLDAEDSSSYVGALKSRYRELARRVRDTAAALDTADTALQIMPGMLGQSGQRSYVLMFQNNAEVRSTGGLPGAFALLNANDGQLTLPDQRTAGDFTALERPILPLSEAEEAIYGPQLGTFIQDANFTPDFPRTAELVKARWESEFSQRVDGVFAVDPIALSYLLGAVGAVTVDGVELTADNVVDEILHEPYLRYDSAGQDEFFRQVARAVFEKVVSGDGDPQAIIRALAKGGHEHRLYAHSFDQAEQSALSGTAVAGELVTEPTTGPHVGVYLNDTTASKMSYYLRTKARVDSTSCSDGVQVLDGTARLKSVAPADAGETLPADVTGGGATGLDPGTQLVAVRLYAPVGGELERVTLNGKVLDDIEVVVHDNRPVGTTFVSLEPQQTVDLGWRMRSGPDQGGDVVVTVTPSAQPGNASTTAHSSC